MQSYLNDLDSNLIFIKKEIINGTIYIFCESINYDNKAVHSRKTRVIKDIPYGEFKVELHIISKKYFNINPNINKLTVSETFEFINSTGRRTKRLDELILRTCKEMSAIGCERYINEKISNVSDSSILRLIKKNE